MVNNEKKHLIWTNVLDYEDWKEYLDNEYPEEDFTEEERIRVMYEVNDEYLEDEKENLNKPLGQSIVVIGTLGLWDGTRHGWRILKGSNLNDCLDTSETCGDYITWYVDEDGEFCCDDIHHDGTNHYVYRAINADISDWEFGELMAEGADIDTLTEKLGHYVAEIYGF